MMDIPDEQRMNTKIIKQHRDLSKILKIPHKKNYYFFKANQI